MDVRIVSGGQTGVDRAALELAVDRGVPYGGWCPAGGWAEDHEAPPGIRTLFPDLQETPSADPAQRTEWNVRDSDATLIVVDSASDDSPGTDLAAKVAGALGRPLLVVDLADARRRDQVAGFLDGLSSGRGADVVLNIAGPRESERPGIHDATRAFLAEVADLFVAR